MKKKYMKPTVEVVEIRKPSLLAGSITQSGDNLNVTFDDSEYDWGDQGIN